MKFVGNRINRTHLRDLLPTISDELEVDFVLAAIAYGGSASDEARDLLGHAVKNKLRLDLWMRYDETVPVSISFLKRLLKHQKDNVFTQFVPDCFHSKVIWWKGYGAYIGSANHTDRGWMTNIEAGIFLTEDELAANGMDAELEEFFDYLKELPKCIPLSSEYIAEQQKLSELNKGAFTGSRKSRAHPVWGGPVFIDKKKAIDRRKENFRSEWLDTLGILQSIGEQLLAYRPKWIDESVPSGWQVDQFLHAFYYNHLGEGLLKPYEEYHQKNKRDPNRALRAELEWWQSLSKAPSNEDQNLFEHAPVVQRLLSSDQIQSLTESEIATLFSKTHATMDHAIKIPLSVLGKPELKTLDRYERVKLFAALIMRERNRLGWDIGGLLEYVLYGGQDEKLWERLYNAGRNPEYSIPRYGLNSLAEVVGWARPEVAPPRNGRTSKALYALGFNVKIY